jgi:hypothetical protein
MTSAFAGPDVRGRNVGNPVSFASVQVRCAVVRAAVLAGWQWGVGHVSGLV